MMETNVDTDACTNACAFARCGDKLSRAGVEDCDDGNANVGDGCNAQCQTEACGNGRLDHGEACDDGNQVDNDGCSNACTEGFIEGTTIANWRAFNFRDRGHKDGCAGGAKYIKSTSYQGIYVGVTLCNAGRYKIWLSASIHGVFESIGDGSGSGQDHCEFVGGTHQRFQVVYTSNAVPAAECREGQRPQHGTLGERIGHRAGKVQREHP